MNAQTIAETAIATARKHANNGALMQTSAEFCIKDAECLFAQGRFFHAATRALVSLEYSIGIFHPDHESTFRLIHGQE